MNAIAGTWNESELQEQAVSLAEQSRSIKIINQETYDIAADRLLVIKDLRDKAEAHHRPVIESAHKTHKLALAALAAVDNPLKAAEASLKGEIGRYEAEQRRIEAEQRAQAEKEALAFAAAQREREIEEAEAAGADAAEVAAICAEPLPAVLAELPEPVFQRAAGISAANNWKGECVSLAQLVQAIAAGKANINLVAANGTAINALARATRGTLTVPGIKFFNEPTVRARR